MLHVFYKASAREVTTKLNRIRRKSVKFDLLEFTMDHDTDAQTCYLGHSLPGNYAIMLRRSDIESIAHEVWHVVMDHGRYIGLEHNEASEESYAYLFGYLIKQIHDFTQKGS